MDSEDPLNTLIKLSQNFPKYSTTIAAHNATADLRKEIRENRARMIPAGYNVMWINGMQIDSRQIDAFSMLDLLRRERTLIQKFRDLSLSAQEAVKLLSHPALAEVQAEDESQRYDYRDTREGGQVIIWMNDLEKDPRYEAWPSNLETVCLPLHFTYLPGIMLTRNPVHHKPLPGTIAPSSSRLAQRRHAR
jgi:UDP-glucose:glycoprotein glucosyltransferase